MSGIAHAASAAPSRYSFSGSLVNAVIRITATSRAETLFTK
jgi:hypothetical protein